jgi:hypothetical protein
MRPIHVLIACGTVALAVHFAWRRLWGSLLMLRMLVRQTMRRRPPPIQYDSDDEEAPLKQD